MEIGLPRRSRVKKNIFGMYLHYLKKKETKQFTAYVLAKTKMKLYDIIALLFYETKETHHEQTGIF